MATYLISQLVEYPENAALTNSVDWYIMPVMNPDGKQNKKISFYNSFLIFQLILGYEYTHTGNRLWRKTRSGKGSKCPGADPNRNFGHKWGGKGTSRDKW